MALAITVDYLELGEEFGLAGGADEQGEFEIKPYLVAYGDRGNFINQLAALSSVSGGLGGRVTYQVPYQLPDNPRLYYRSCTWKPEGELIKNPPGYNGPIQYSHAVVTATFRQPQFNYQGNDDPGFMNSLSQDPAENQSMLFATQEIDFAREWMTIPNSSVKFMSDGKPVNTYKGRSVLNVAMRITFHNYPILPFAVFRQYADSVNDATFLGCDKGTVFFEGPKTIREANTDGTVTQKLMLGFKWRKYDWNKQLRDDGILWDYVVSKDSAIGNGPPSSSDTNYAYQPFSKLLQLLNP